MMIFENIDVIYIECVCVDDGFSCIEFFRFCFCLYRESDVLEVLWICSF